MSLALDGVIEALLGDNIPIEVEVTERDGADLSSATATISIYKSGGALVASDDMVGSGTTTRRFSYLLQTQPGDGAVLSEIGHYRLVIQVTFESTIKSWTARLDLYRREA